MEALNDRRWQEGFGTIKRRRARYPPHGELGETGSLWPEGEVLPVSRGWWIAVGAGNEVPLPSSIIQYHHGYYTEQVHVPVTRQKSQE